jgi:hypothetical protein
MFAVALSPAIVQKIHLLHRILNGLMTAFPLPRGRGSEMQRLWVTAGTIQEFFTRNT